MKVNYPNGPKSFLVLNNEKKGPNSKKSRLGTNFEKAINESNLFYLNKDLAIIHKKPTPVQVVKVDYPARTKAKITEAYYKIPSTTDYNGLYRGKYIDFEAKSCNSTSFPFSHLFKHQILHLASVSKHGGISFLLIEFVKHQEIFLLPTPKLIEVYQEAEKGGRKSIPYQFFKDHGYLILPTFSPRIDYLKIIDMLYFKNPIDF